MSCIDIITRTINRPELLERALLSILAQTFEDWHWVVVDGGNSQHVENLLAKYSTEIAGRFTHIRFQNATPGMRGVPINVGIKGSHSELITLLDDDDTWTQDFLTVMIRELRELSPHASVRGVVCRTMHIEETSVRDGLQMLSQSVLNPSLHNLTLAKLSVVNCFCTHAFVYKRSALDAVGMYPEDYPVLEDWHFNLRFLMNYEIMVVPLTLTNYHFRPHDAAGDEANSQTAQLRLHKFHEGRLINEAIRGDLKSGAPGLGHILSQAVLTRQLNDTLHLHGSRLKSIGEKTGKIDSRTKVIKDAIKPRK